MARKIIERIRVKGELVAQSPLHVGGLGGDPTVDLALAVDGQGRYYIPGTSLAGSLRASMNEGNSNPDITDLWGPKMRRGAEQGHASFLTLSDAPIAGDVSVEIRDGVGIDRFSGTAAEQVKFDRAVLPRGTKIPFMLRLDVAEKHLSTHPVLLAQLLETLNEGEIQIGAARTRGLGRVKLENLKIRKEELSTPEGILTALTQNSGTNTKLETLLGTTRSSQGFFPKLSIRVDWQPIGPVMVKAETEGLAVDILPLTTLVGDQVTFVLPGSSIKGALRSQAERIMRTLLSQTDFQEGKGNEFIKQLDLELVRKLFGFANQNKRHSQGGFAGCLSVADCYAQLRMSYRQWAAIRDSTEVSPLQTALSRAALGETQQAFHIAIDRWTGGAADGFLYSNLEPIGFDWDPIRLILDLGRLENENYVGLTLLLLVLRDLSSGRIPLGYGTNRGMGSIKIDRIHIQGRYLESDLSSLEDLILEGGDLRNLDETLRATLESDWKEWLKEKGGDL